MSWNPYDNLPPAASFSLTSSDLREGEKLAMPQVSGIFGAGDESGSGLPQGAFQLPNDARMARYCGAGPPPGHGRHRYIFAVLALEAERIEIDREATPAWMMFNLFNGTLGRAFLEGWYER